MVNGSFCKWYFSRCPVLWHLLFRVISVLIQYYQSPSLDAENDIKMLNVSLTTNKNLSDPLFCNINNYSLWQQLSHLLPRWNFDNFGYC